MQRRRALTPHNSASGDSAAARTAQAARPACRTTERGWRMRDGEPPPSVTRWEWHPRHPSLEPPHEPPFHLKVYAHLGYTYTESKLLRSYITWGAISGVTRWTPGRACVACVTQCEGAPRDVSEVHMSLP